MSSDYLLVKKKIKILGDWTGFWDVEKKEPNVTSGKVIWKIHYGNHCGNASEN